jgi:hypothetical protein
VDYKVQRKPVTPLTSLQWKLTVAGPGFANYAIVVEGTNAARIGDKNARDNLICSLSRTILRFWIGSVYHGQVLLLALLSPTGYIVAQDLSEG